MLFVQLAVVLVFIMLGARLGGLGIAFAGAAGVIVLGVLGAPVNATTGIPWDVLGIILAVISAVAAMQTAGGMDLLVKVSERLLRRHPKRISFYAPIITYLMTFLCGTGNVAFATLPVIAEVAKEGHIRPSRPLSIAVVASQIAIVASPISAATVAMSVILEPRGIPYATMVLFVTVITFLGTMVGAVFASRQGVELDDDPVYRDRLAKGLVHTHGSKEYDIKPYARRSLIIFGATLVVVMVYATAVTALDNPPLPRTAAIMCAMMTAALLTTLLCHIDLSEVTNQSTFKGGMSASLCILGVAWLGSTFVAANLDALQDFGQDVIQQYPWLLAVVLFFGAALLYSQGATTVTFMPIAAAMNVSASAMLASFPAVSALFVLPTYPTVVAAMEMDDTGTTRIGKFVLAHPFLWPGVITIAAAVLLGFVLGPILL
jgi:anaerobic C4-dicarboxylate transporter DcuA